MKNYLVSLAMIVKDEAASIASTIASVREAVDHYLILDTGSTDGTPEVARVAFDGTPGDIVHEAFVDFASTRNRAVELAEQAGAAFVLMLSGNETLRGDVQVLRRFSQEQRTHPMGGYLLECAMSDLSYKSVRLSRSGAGWRYVGATHEVMTGPNGEVAELTVPGVHVFHDTSGRSWEAARRRWLSDVEILSAVLKCNPRDTRAAFYLAQSYEMLREPVAAIAAYRRRVEMGGWREEVFVSLLRIARVMRSAGMLWPEVQDAFLAAFAHSPHRAEPLYEIGKHYYQVNQHDLAYLFLARAAEIPFPAQERLFVEPSVYENVHDLLSVSAWYAGRFLEGEVATRKALERAPDDPRLRHNLSFYAERKRPPRQLTGDLDADDLRQRLGSTPVVVSLTTIPSRWGLLKHALASILAQHFRPDTILVTVPERSAREDAAYVVPAWLDALPRVRVVRTERDYGPATKLLGALAAIDDPDAILVTFDDDIEYEEHVLEKLVDRALRYPGAAVGFSGLNLERLIDRGEYELVYEQFGRRSQDPTPANVLEGHCGVAYRRRFFDDDVFNTTGYPPEVFFVDDIWFAGYLARKSIPKLVFHYSDLTLTHDEVWLRIWKQHGLSADSNPLHLLSGFVEKNRKVAAAFKQRDPEIWERELDPAVSLVRSSADRSATFSVGISATKIDDGETARQDR